MNLSFLPETFDADLAPNQAEIEQCARELWVNSGRPEGNDKGIWLEAERRLISARRAPLRPDDRPRAPIDRRSSDAGSL